MRPGWLHQGMYVKVYDPEIEFIYYGKALSVGKQDFDMKDIRNDIWSPSYLMWEISQISKEEYLRQKALKGITE